MDILAARKKAAERAQEQKKKEQERAAAAEPAVVRDAAPAVAPEAGPKSAPEVLPVQPVPENTTAPVKDAPAETETAAGPATVEGEQAGDGAPEEPQQAQEVEMLSFRLGLEEYALLIEDVREVLKIRDVTPVPNAPAHILGVTSLRGPILPVLDLCKRLGVPPGVRDEKSRILVVSLNEEDIGVVVDRVTGVIRIDPASIRPAPDTIEHGAEYLRGIARKGDKLYILLDKEKALGG
jgi:purine-binding chemotaxis protein CheW